MLRPIDLAYFPAFLLYLPTLAWQAIVMGKRRGGWKERFGFIENRPGERECVWIHAVSLGEVNATRSLVDEIERRLPGWDVVISATTDTGFAAAKKQYPTKQVIRYPLDFTFSVQRVLDRIRPAAIILMELEVWPNVVRLARERGIPIGIANGRVTEERSMRRFRLPIIRNAAKRMFRQMAWVGAQDATYADRFAELGVPRDRIHVTGSLKYDTAVIADRVDGADVIAKALGIDPDASLIVAGSTGPGEEEIILTAYDELLGDRADLQLAVVPRKPERFDEVARLIESRGFACVRRSRNPDPAGPAKDSKRVILGDTMGELRKFYSLARVVFVGRTLVPMGGSDLMEVAGLGKAMCFGPHVENFRDVAEKLLEVKAAVQIEKTDQLSIVLAGLLHDSAASAAMGSRAQDVVRQNLGATKRTVDLLCSTFTTSPRPERRGKS